MLACVTKKGLHNIYLHITRIRIILQLNKFTIIAFVVILKKNIIKNKQNKPKQIMYICEYNSAGFVT